MSDFQLPQPIPQLVHEHSQNVTAVLGKAALLNCRVRGIGNKTVSKLSSPNTFRIDMDVCLKVLYVMINNTII